MAWRIPRVVGRIAWRGPQNAEDFRFLKPLTTRTPKITLPGPCYIHYRAGRANISRDVYPDLDTFWTDLVEAYIREMRSLADAGCSYLQIENIAGQARNAATIGATCCTPISASSMPWLRARRRR
jgi:5-methyltetrahydropteroyltriglutamate--homocysteine methyltransferase